MWTKGIYQQNNLFFSKRKGLDLHYFHSSCVLAEWIPLSLLLSIHSISLFCLLKIWKVAMPLSWHWHEETSRQKVVRRFLLLLHGEKGSTFSASIFEELRYLLKAFFSIFFKLVFIYSWILMVATDLNINLKITLKLLGVSGMKICHSRVR